MKRRREVLGGWVLVLGSIGCASAGKTGAPADVATSKADEWVTVKEEAYALSSPAPWKTFSTSVDLGQGVHVRQWGGTTDEVTTGRYGFLCMDFPRPLAQKMDRSTAGRQQMLAQLERSDEPSSMHPFQVNGIAGDDVTFDTGEQRGRLRSFWVGDSLCLLSAFAKDRVPPTADRFFASFEIRKAWKHVREEGDLFEVDVPWTARHVASTRDDTVIHDVVEGDTVTCRVVVQPIDIEEIDLAQATRLLRDDFVRRRVTIDAESDGNAHAPYHEFAVTRPDGVRQTIRAVAGRRRFFVVTSDEFGDSRTKRCQDSFAPIP